MSKYAVIHEVTERTAPIITAYGRTIIRAGTVLDISDTITVDDETWGKVNNRSQVFVCISMAEKTYLAPMVSQPDPRLLEKLIIWAQMQGFKP